MYKTLAHLEACVSRGERSPPRQSGNTGSGTTETNNVKINNCDENTVGSDHVAALAEQYQGVGYHRITAANISLPSNGDIVPLEELLPAPWAARLLSGEGILQIGPAPPFRPYHDVAGGNTMR